jgi:uncharacterized protein YjbJ (UPF0337 family)
MDSDRVSGTARNYGGKAEEFVGKATGDAQTQLRGKVDQAVGAAQDMYGQAKDVAADAAGRVRDTAMDAEDYVRHIIEEKPYTVAFAALAVGFILGRMGRRD